MLDAVSQFFQCTKHDTTTHCNFRDDNVGGGTAELGSSVDHGSLEVVWMCGVRLQEEVMCGLPDPFEGCFIHTAHNTLGCVMARRVPVRVVMNVTRLNLRIRLGRRRNRVGWEMHRHSPFGVQ